MAFYNLGSGFSPKGLEVSRTQSAWSRLNNGCSKSSFYEAGPLSVPPYEMCRSSKPGCLVALVPDRPGAWSSWCLVALGPHARTNARTNNNITIHFSVLRILLFLTPTRSPTFPPNITCDITPNFEHDIICRSLRLLVKARNNLPHLHVWQWTNRIFRGSSPSWVRRPRSVSPLPHSH